MIRTRMSVEVLRELMIKWENDAKEPDTADGSDEAKIPTALAKGERAGRYKSAQELSHLISILGR